MTMNAEQVEKRFTDNLVHAEPLNYGYSFFDVISNIIMGNLRSLVNGYSKLQPRYDVPA